MRPYVGGCLATLFLLLAACWNEPGTESSSASSPNTEDAGVNEDVGYGLGSNYDGVGGTPSTTKCGGKEIDTERNPFYCCPTIVTDQASSGNCTWYAWARAYEAWGIEMWRDGPLGVPLGMAYEESLPPELYLHNGQRRRALRYKDGGASLASNPTNSAFAWAHIVRNSGSTKLSVSEVPIPNNSIGVSSTAGADGHVAWITGTFSKNGDLWVRYKDQQCKGDYGVPETTTDREKPASYFDEGFIVYSTGMTPPTISMITSPEPTVPVSEDYSVALSANDADGDLSEIAIDWNDGSANEVENVFVSGGSATATFTRSFQTARTIHWSASAYDARGVSSNLIQGSFSIEDAASGATSPTISLVTSSGSTVPVSESYFIELNAIDADGDLSEIAIDWNDGSANEVENVFVSGGSATATFTRSFQTARTIHWSASAYDLRGVNSNLIQGGFSVQASAPPTSGYSTSITSMSSYCFADVAVVDVFFTANAGHLFTGEAFAGDSRDSTACSNNTDFGGTGGQCAFAFAPKSSWVGKPLTIKVRETTTNGPWVEKNYAFPSNSTGCGG